MKSKSQNMRMIDVYQEVVFPLMNSYSLHLDGLVFQRFGESLIVKSEQNLEVTQTELIVLNFILNQRSPSPKTVLILPQLQQIVV